MIFAVRVQSIGRTLFALAIFDFDGWRIRPVRFHVLVQMITAHESFAALYALESLFARMRSSVSLQLVATGESLVAEQPRTHERPFARVPTKMRLQMRRFVIHFATAGNVTVVFRFLVGIQTVWNRNALAHCLLTIRTVAIGPSGVST